MLVLRNVLRTQWMHDPLLLSLSKSELPLELLAIFSRIICTFCHYRPPKNMKRISPYSFNTWRYPCQWKHCNISTQTQCEITGSSSNQTDQNSSLSSNVVAYLPLNKELVWYVIYIHFRKLLFFSFLH